MAVTATAKANVADGTNLSSYPTDASWTPTAGRLAACIVCNAHTSSPATPTVSGNGMTWSQVATYVCDTVNPLFRITAFVALTGGSPSAEVVTADFGGAAQIGCAMLVDEFDGADVSGTALDAVVQSKTGSVDTAGTSESITLDSAITSGNASYGGLQLQHANAVTPGNGHSQVQTDNHTGPVSQLLTLFKSAGSQTVDGSWTNSVGKGGIAMEIKAAGASTKAPPPFRSTATHVITRRF